MRAEKELEKYKKITDDENEKIYQIHHLHHFLKKKYIKHEIHHCFLFSKKNMKGEKFRVFHKVQGKNFWHCVVGNPEVDKLFDHKNNIYEIKKIKIKGDIFSVINF